MTARGPWLACFSCTKDAIEERGSVLQRPKWIHCEVLNGSLLFAIFCFSEHQFVEGKNVGWVRVKGNIILGGIQKSTPPPNPLYHCLKAPSCEWTYSIWAPVVFEWLVDMWICPCQSRMLLTRASVSRWYIQNSQLFFMATGKIICAPRVGDE